MGLLEGLIKQFGPGVAIDIIRKTPWRKIGEEQAKPIDTLLDNQFKNKKSELLQAAIILAIDEFTKGLKDGLLVDQKGK
jgi:hypothetical protein